MIAYFTASVVGKKQYLKEYENIIRILTENKIDVTSDHVMKATIPDIRIVGIENRLAFHKQLEGWISSSDFVVAEASYPSISVGYEISLASHMGKPVLLLYTDENPPTFLVRHEDDNIICEKYNKENLEEIINDFIRYAEGTDDSRFTFYITSKIANYLNKVSKKEKLPKSVYLRKLIEKDMKS